jgi:hypothetical protein
MPLSDGGTGPVVRPPAAAWSSCGISRSPARQRCWCGPQRTWRCREARCDRGSGATSACRPDRSRPAPGGRSRTLCSLSADVPGGRKLPRHEPRAVVGIIALGSTAPLSAATQCCWRQPTT